MKKVRELGMLMSGFGHLGLEETSSAKALRQEHSRHVPGAEESSVELATESGRRGNHRGSSRQRALGLKDFGFESVQWKFTGRF